LHRYEHRQRWDNPLEEEHYPLFGRLMLCHFIGKMENGYRHYTVADAHNSDSHGITLFARLGAPRSSRSYKPVIGRFVRLSSQLPTAAMQLRTLCQGRCSCNHLQSIARTDASSQQCLYVSMKRRFQVLHLPRNVDLHISARNFDQIILDFIIAFCFEPWENFSKMPYR